MPTENPATEVIQPLDKVEPLTSLNLEDMMAADENLVKLATESAETTSLSKPQGVPYAEMETAEFLLASRIFMQRKIATQDILSRSALIELKDRQGSISVTDGMFSMYATFHFAEKTADFPESLVVDLETLFKVSQVQGKKFYLIWKESQLYVDFFGGQIYIPTYNITASILQYKQVKSEQQVTLSAEDFLNSLQVANRYAQSIPIPDLSFVFYKPNAMYLANGSSVIKFAGSFCDMVIRKSDIQMLTLASQLSLKTALSVKFSEERIAFGSPVMELQFPNVQAPFSEEFVKMVSFFPTEYFTIDFARLMTVLTIFDKMPQSSGVVSFKASNNALYASTKTRDGKESKVSLSQSVEGADQVFDLYLGSKGLLSSIRALQPAALVKFAVKGDHLYINAGPRNLCFFGKAERE